MILPIFDLQVAPIRLTKFRVNLPFASGEETQKGFPLRAPIGTILAILIYKLSRYFPSSFESIGFSVQEKKSKIDFQDGGHSGHLGFSIGTIFIYF